MAQGCTESSVWALVKRESVCSHKEITVVRYKLGVRWKDDRRPSMERIAKRIIDSVIACDNDLRDYAFPIQTKAQQHTYQTQQSKLPDPNPMKSLSHKTLIEWNLNPMYPKPRERTQNEKSTHRAEFNSICILSRMYSSWTCWRCVSSDSS